ncbi:MAG: electron transfer flavoprotein subunit alpha/FixB family protein [Thaumarchaeota archaeon]|nr:electron transfer flavoprotein subunit alpha/FixB family protein [Nitrososphaerota archaeon]
MAESQPRDVWVYVEHYASEITGPTLEVLAAGRKVADKLNHKMVAVILGSGVEKLAYDAVQYGADQVIYSDHHDLNNYGCLQYTRVLYEMVQERHPNVMLFVADEIGRDLAPRLAYRLGTGLATDNIELDVADYFHAPSKTTFKNLLVQIRPDFATRVAKIYTPRTRPQIATVRPGNFKPSPRDPKRKGEVIPFFTVLTPDDFKVVVEGIEELPKSGVDLEGANCVVSLGLGILKDGKGIPRNPLEGYKLAKDLGDAVASRWGMKVEIGSSRGLIYARLKELEGIITAERQIGQTGKTVSPDVYFALGISGSVQHKVGMHRSAKIVAINLNPKSPIFEIAHYPIVGDLYEIVPKLIEEIRRR